MGLRTSFGRLALAFVVAAAIGPVLFALIPSLPTRLLSGIAAGTIVFWIAKRRHPELSPNAEARRYGQILVGIRVAFAIDVGSLASHLPLVGFDLAIALFMIFSSMAIGWAYARLARQEMMTAMLATLPGGVSIMSAIAADEHRNVTAVAMVQVMRVTAVVLAVAVISAFTPFGSAYNNGGFFAHLDAGLSVTNLIWYGAILGAALVAVRLAQRAHIAAAPFFGSVIVGLMANWLGVPFLSHLGLNPELPAIFSIAGQILLGIALGEVMANEFVFERLVLIYGSLSVFATLVVALIVAILSHEVYHTDLMTSILVAAPGGSIEMMTLALAVKSDLAIVASAQVIRMLMINLLLPVWIGMFRRFETLATRRAVR